MVVAAWFILALQVLQIFFIHGEELPRQQHVCYLSHSVLVRLIGCSLLIADGAEKMPIPVTGRSIGASLAYI